MILRDALALLDGESLIEGTDLSMDIPTACGADLMSDMLAFIHSGSLLLTGLTHPQVVLTADVVDVAAIVFVRGRVPPRETLELAIDRGIPLASSPHTLFECCGRLYAAGIEACDVRGEERSHTEKRLRALRQKSPVAGNA